MRADDRRMISCWRLTVALPHSAISAMERPQPVQTLELVSRVQISLHGDGGWSRIEYSSSYAGISAPERHSLKLVPPDTRLRAWRNATLVVSP